MSKNELLSMYEKVCLVEIDRIWRLFRMTSPDCQRTTYKYVAEHYEKDGWRVEYINDPNWMDNGDGGDNDYYVIFRKAETPAEKAERLEYLARVQAWSRS